MLYGVLGLIRREVIYNIKYNTDYVNVQERVRRDRDFSQRIALEVRAASKDAGAPWNGRVRPCCGQGLMAGAGGDARSRMKSWAWSFWTARRKAL